MRCVLDLKGRLTPADVAAVARQGAEVVLAADATESMRQARSIVEELVRGDTLVYGVNTGFGGNAGTHVPLTQLRALQRNLIYGCVVGVGPMLDREIVRATMLLSVASLARGHSGIRPEVAELIVHCLNQGIHPLVPAQGSVGSSGDLAPLAHIAYALLGEGDVEIKGRHVSALNALSSVGLRPIDLETKEGLSLTNGTHVMTGIAALAVYDAARLSKLADISAAMSVEALRGSSVPFHELIHSLRPFKGQVTSAQNLRKLLQGSEIVSQPLRVQDPYSLRCVPQVHGASRDALDHVAASVSVELNSVTDNPVVFVDRGLILSGGNFHGEPIGLTMDYLACAVAELASIAERRIALLTDGQRSGLPPFLVEESGFNNGFMMMQYTAAALVSENKVLCHPASIDSLPTSANQEDHNSMGTIAARKCRAVLENAGFVIAIELLCAAQGLDFRRPSRPGIGVAAGQNLIRRHVPHLEVDRPLSPLIDRCLDLMRTGQLADAVESACGGLL